MKLRPFTVVAASGPSMTADDLDYCRGGASVIVVNSTWLLAPWADALYAADWSWWKAHHAAVIAGGFNGECWTIDRDASVKFRLNRVRGVSAPGFSATPGVVHTGLNSGYQACQLAFLHGARRVVLLGFDMARKDGRAHWHPDFATPDRTPNDFKQWIARFETVPASIAPHGWEIVNASRETALTCFPRMELREALGLEMAA